MVNRARKLISMVLSPPRLKRDQAIGASERICALTTLGSSLEYLRIRNEMGPGGLHDWSVMREAHTDSPPALRAALDILSTPAATTTLHAARAAVSAAMLLPGASRARGLGSAFLAVSGGLVFTRHRYGTDGSDQVAILVQSGNAVSRLARSPRVQDAAIWHTALQANLSYVVSGWYKLLGRSWRSGLALSQIMRTRTYGHPIAHTLAADHPESAKALVYGVMGLECLFPLVYAARGRLAKPVLASALAFHAANGYLMGLGRFLTAFAAMHPHVAYTAAPKSLPSHSDRDDSAVVAVWLSVAGAATTMAVAAAQRRVRVRQGPRGTRRIAMGSGNVLGYRFSEGDDGAPVLVLVNGLAATSEQFAWIAEAPVMAGCGVLRYDRPGYGASRRAAGTPDDPTALSEELVEMIKAVVPGTRDIVLVGHSLGGDIARRAAPGLEQRLAGVVYLDPSHPGQLLRSTPQHETSERLRTTLVTMDWTIRLGGGALMQRPEWLQSLPSNTRDRAFAEYSDARMWSAARREWDALRNDYSTFDGNLPPVACPALVLTAQKTAHADHQQLLMHKEIAEAHRAGGAEVACAVVEGTDHDSLMTNSTYAVRVASQIMEFVRDQAHGSAEVRVSIFGQEEAR